MQKILWISALLGAAMLFGCKKPETAERSVAVKITVNRPSVLGNALLQKLEGTLTQKDETVVCTVADDSVLVAKVRPGSWELKVTALYGVSWNREGVLAQRSELVTVPSQTGEYSTKISLTWTPSYYRDGFVITEIFAVGTQKPDGTNYIDDKYIILANASKEKTLYLDGYVLLCSNFLSSSKRECTPAVPFMESFPVKVIYQFPGKGDEHPVKPGERVVICQSAINHADANPLSMDLSKANYEWLDDMTGAPPKMQRPNNPNVPNMKAVFVLNSQGHTVWLVNMQESETFAIGKFDGVTAEEFVKNKANTFDYVWTINGKTMGQNLRKPLLFPNAWIDDAVSLGIDGATEWAVISPLLDAGFTSAAASKKDKERFFKSVQRKRASDGSWVDTNNSTNDFERGRATLLPPAQ